MQDVQVGTKVIAAGVEFFDFAHHQTGHAGNYIELHPLISLRALLVASDAVPPDERRAEWLVLRESAPPDEGASRAVLVVEASQRPPAPLTQP